MDSFNNVEIYKKEPIEGSTLNYLYFRDDKGRDWYDTRSSWVGALATNSDNLVCAFEEDITLMTMVEGQSVYNIAADEVPGNVVGNFFYVDGNFISVPNFNLINKKSFLIQEASLQLSMFEALNEIEGLSDKETEEFRKWKLYLVNLYRTDVTTSIDINWPEKPI